MSTLKLFQPEQPSLDERREVECDARETISLPFPPDAVLPTEASRLDVVLRARTLYRNRLCPACGRGTVEPVVQYDTDELSAIPGLGTLTGFRCRLCHCEWAVTVRRCG